MSVDLAGTYLERITSDVARRLDSHVPMDASTCEQRPTRSLIASIEAARARGELAIIGEVKRRSPSVGSIDEHVDPRAQASAYAAGGAAGISVLTEADHFGGSLADLVEVAAIVDVPVLRKDFIIDERQIADAAAAGADAVLLIATIHDDAQLERLVAAAHDRSLEVLLEVHDEGEMRRALATRADVIGINNRDLRSFAVDLAVSERVAAIARGDGRPIVAESGVRTQADAARMRRSGVDALLVGEALMRAADPAELLRALRTCADEQGHAG